MKNKKNLGIIISICGFILSIASYFYTSSLDIVIPTDGYRNGFEILLLQFGESKLLIPFIIGIVLFFTGIIIYLLDLFKKKK